MRNGWVTKKLVEVATLQRGFDLPTKKRVSGIYPLVTSSGVTDTHHEYAVRGPGVVTGRSGSIGNVFFVEEDYWPLNTVLYVRDFHGNDPRFVYYLLKRFDLLRFASGAGVPTLNRNVVHSELVQVPPLAEQKRIVAILDEAFAAIDQATANTQQNLANARELFDCRVRAAFANAEGEWKRRRLGDICENLDSRRVPITKSKRQSGDIPYYGASGIVDYVADFIFDEDLLLVSEDGANLLARTYPIAFSISGKSWVNNHAHVLRFSTIASQRFVEYYLNSISLRDYVSGMAQPKLNQKSLNSILVPLPDITTQEDLVESLDSLWYSTQLLDDQCQKKCEHLADLRQSILQKAFRGDLTTATAEAEFAGAVADE